MAEVGLRSPKSFFFLDIVDIGSHVFIFPYLFRFWNSSRDYSTAFLWGLTGTAWIEQDMLGHVEAALPGWRKPMMMVSVQYIYKYKLN